MTETKLKEHITSEHFGIPTDFADRVANYAAWRVQALSEQLAEAQALIEASRKQEHVAYSYALASAWAAEEVKLYTAPVVADDVLKDAQRYRFLEYQCRVGEYRGIISRKAIDEAMGGTA